VVFGPLAPDAFYRRSGIDQDAVQVEQNGTAFKHGHRLSKREKETARGEKGVKSANNSAAALVYDFQPGCDLVQRLLNAIKFGLGSFRKLLNALRSAFQMTGNVAHDFAPALAQEEHAKPSQKYAQASETICELFVFVHCVDPAFAAAHTRSMLLKNMMQNVTCAQKESSWMRYLGSEWCVPSSQR
jgi:hypothetical protein